MEIYGTSHSRAFRVLWMACEQETEFVHHPLAVERCGGDAAYLALNPAGTIPLLKDGDFVLAESLAINLYLARKHGRMWPADEREQALALQWSFWAQATLEGPYILWAEHSLWLPAALRDAAKREQAAQDLRRPLDRLERALRDRRYLLGDSFSAADLNVAAVINGLADFEPQARPHVHDWLRRCLSRPAYLRASQLP
ncbi:glutathione S-transferase family protein [Chromobacterium sp. IIBBL 290-4]|uniref:glutathione S-transferase family protein n=1 Tax=Chromobacterium sp. IIBBL 290-4 TaxID=2953890 RepID=UPI0020B73B50|nr:glutathione S-transferase family protein [Chromobacterium sp. IIBBL 290-4]UTH75355.1 glutathione S-transferase family protein [Chromobacterium sp. IIBBL 290-4]